MLTRNVPNHGQLNELRGNYLLNHTIGVETHLVNVNGNPWDDAIPDDAAIRMEFDIDQRFIGSDYAVASAERSAAIREFARTEGVFVGPVYTGQS